MKKFLLLIVVLLLLGGRLIWSGEVDATEIYLQGKVYAAEIVGEGPFGFAQGKKEETKIELAEYQVEKIQRSYEKWVKDFEKRKAELEDQVASSKLKVARGEDSSFLEAGLELQKLQKLFDTTKADFEQQKAKRQKVNARKTPVVSAPVRATPAVQKPKFRPEQEGTKMKEKRGVMPRIFRRKII